MDDDLNTHTVGTCSNSNHDHLPSTPPAPKASQKGAHDNGNGNSSSNNNASFEGMFVLISSTSGPGVLLALSLCLFSNDCYIVFPAEHPLTPDIFWNFISHK